MMSTTTDRNSERAALIERLQNALDALEHNDEAGWRQEIDTIAAWRTRPMIQGLSRLARELAQALGELPALPDGAGDLSDACSRLDHVVEMTEKASMRTLDLAEECRDLTANLRSGELNAEHGLVLDRIHHNLTELVLTQSYQDLTGQIIRRVVSIVRHVHEGFDALGLPPKEDQPDAGGLAGPAVKGLDHHAVSQDDADELLSGLGL